MAKTTADARDVLVQTARFLHNAAPREFDQFLAAFQQYTDNVTKDLIDTTLNLERAQGHAQQCRKIAQLLEQIKGA